jgi:hypothetical protein
MARVCTVCEHKERQRIMESVMRRVPYREIAERYGLDKSSLTRHLRHHVSPALRKLASNEMTLVEAGAIAEPVLLEMRKLYRRCLGMLDKAEEAKDYATALHAVRECRRNLELIAKLTGELNPVAPGEEAGGALNVTVVYADKAAIVASGSKALPEPEGAVN